MSRSLALDPKAPFIVSVALAVAVAGLSTGCEEFFCCPVSDPIARPAARADLVGTWRASLQFNEVTPWTSPQNDPLVADAFLHFDGAGDLQSLGLLTPDGSAGLWLVDFAAGRASGAFQIERSGVVLNHAADITSAVDDDDADGDVADPNTPGATVEYALQADQGFGVVGFALAWRIEDLRIDATGQILTGLLVQTERELGSPAGATTTLGGSIWLHRVDAAIQEPTGAIDVVFSLTPQAGGQIPHPTGAIFDLDAGDTTGPPGLTYQWTVQRNTLDAYGRFVSTAWIDVPDGPQRSFTAEAPGTYFVRCWVTDGVQWATGFPRVTRVE